MTARVFISYRSSDGADKATALARDLDALFGHDQIFLDKDDLPAGSRWRDVIANTLHASPILLVLVTPNYLAARDSTGTRCIERADDPVRDELEAALAANAHVIPMMCDGVAQTPPATDLPKPFDQLTERTWRRLRAYDWREDLGRLAEDLRGLGVVPRTTPAELASGPSPLAGSTGAPAATGRRLAIGAVAAVLIGAGAFAGWRWYENEAASLAGRWRASIGKRGATTSRDGEVVIVTIEQNGASLRLASSAVDIERDPDWQNYRDFWQHTKGQPLNRVFYRGEGAVQGEGDSGVGASDAPPGPRRILLSVHVDVPEGGEPIDTCALRGAIDPDGKRIRCRLWLNSEQGERVVDLRREP
jgi:TIR domain